MFLTSWLVTKVITAAVTGVVDYPLAADFFMAESSGTLFFYGGSKDYASNVDIYNDGYSYPIESAYNITTSEPGTYKASADICGVTYMTTDVTVSVPAVSSSSILAFHYGDFDTVYGDASVSVAAANGRVFADTPLGTYNWGSLSAVSNITSNTTYTWTPPVELTADVLMVAGGGGGGGSNGGGGGAGGVLFHQGEILSGQKSITVGSGGLGGLGHDNLESGIGSNGSNTYMTDFITAIGGGGGGGFARGNGSSGGSGGGAGYTGQFGTGTLGQGYAGGDDSGLIAGGGGGGAGGVGYDVVTSPVAGGNGGIGIDYSLILGIVNYGDSGYFASGGGGGGNQYFGTNTAGTASPGGGGGGTITTTKASDGMKHTGGGGGGAGYSVVSNSRLGGSGGSGIVLISYPSPQLTHDTFDKLTVANTSNANVETNLRLGSNVWYVGSVSDVYICKPGAYKSFTVDPDGQVAHFGNVTVGTVTASAGGVPSIILPGGTVAFHHGVFDDVYGDGTVSNAAMNGHVYADTQTGTYIWGTLSARSTTSMDTTYSWTPASDLTANVLMVAGGGGGGYDRAGGGGAGGLLFNENVTISGLKTVVVGSGGARGSNGVRGVNGGNTSLSGLSTVALGGGGGASNGVSASSGGSGGGGSHSPITGSTGTSGQGNNGGNGYLGSGGGASGGGGGGAGATGSTTTTASVAGKGGNGNDLSSTFGTSYGDDGWFAGGGGGGGIGTPGGGGTGGGGAGSGTNGLESTEGISHTGGGGGGGGSDIANGSNGGSGIVLINYEPINPPSQPASLSYDGYNKLSVNGLDDQTLYEGSNSYALGTASNVYIADPGEYTYFTNTPEYAFLSNVTVGAVSVDLTLSETSIAKQFIYDENGYTDALFSEGSETQSIRLSSDGLAMALGDGNYSSSNGRLYYYERSSISGTFTKTHTFDAVSSGLTFGASVDMNAAKTRIAISGSDADTNAANAGRVYIYDRANTSASWPSSPTATITPPASTIKRFGHTVNMSDDGLTMITSGDGSTANECGVYVYEYVSGSWSKTFQVTQGITRFGYKVAMNKTGTRFIAGGTGTAYYVYHKESGTWNSTAALTGATGYYCGMSPDGNTVAVGITQYSSNLGRVAVYKYNGSSWGSVVNIDTTVGSGLYQIGNTPVFNNDGTLLVTGCAAYNSYMGCFEMWKYESGSWVFKKQFLNPTVKTGHGTDMGEFFGMYLSMDYAGTSVIVSNTGNDVAGADYGRVVLYGAGSPPSLTYDGLNSLKVTGAEASSYITYKAYESNKFLACGTDLTTYPLSKTGNYKAEIAGSTTFTLTSNVLVPATNIVPLYQYPPTDGTTSGVTETVTADVNSIWTISSAGYGNGLYHAQASVAATSEPSASEINFATNPWLSPPSWIDVRLVKTSSTSTKAFYQIFSYDANGNDNTPSWMDTRYQIEFRYNASTTGLTTVYANTNNHASDDVPYYFANSAVSQNINVGDTITAYNQAQNTVMYTLTVTSGMLWTNASTSVTAYHAFDNNLTAGFETASTTGTLIIQLPSATTIHKYVVWPKAVDGNRPKSWVIEGSQDTATWYTIHTVTDSPPSLSGDVHEISSPVAYVYYRINVSANNGGTALKIAELVLWGDVAFSITFSDGWVTTNGATSVTLGSAYTLPTYTSSLPVTVTGASDFDVNTAGTYIVVYTSVDINELVRRVVRRFVVA